MTAGFQSGASAPTFPVVEPDFLADQLWRMPIDGTHEFVYPMRSGGE
jgi:hypothetical protein